MPLASTAVWPAGLLAAAAFAVDPTFLRANLDQAPASQLAPGCSYKALFGENTPGRQIVRGVARFGEYALDAGAACPPVSYPRQEEIYFVLSGTGSIRYGATASPAAQGEFAYLAPSVPHALSSSGGPLRAVVMGFHVPASFPLTIPEKLPIANISEVKKQVVGNHPPSTLYQLLMGDTQSTRDRLAAAHVMKSLFIMEITPGGTNTPHHHDTEEEIYVLMDGEGDMVAGSGSDGVEGRFPARPGDAFFYRLNTTVGFYNTGRKLARILAVRSLYPFRNR